MCLDSLLALILFSGRSCLFVEKVSPRFQAEVVGEVPGTDFAAGLGPLRREPAVAGLLSRNLN